MVTSSNQQLAIKRLQKRVSALKRREKLVRSTFKILFRKVKSEIHSNDHSYKK